MLAADFNAELILERFADNPFLPKFYKDPTHYAFPLEMTFLTDRYQQLKNLLSKRDLFTDLVVADYFIDKCDIFSKNNLQPDEYNLFLKVYDIISDFLPKPDILVYLYNTTENLLKNIAKRGRDYEQEIQADYLASIQENYLTFFKQRAQFPILIIESNAMDFVNSVDDYEKIKGLFQREYEVGVHRVIL
jgi:deoxyadenosine/deoxycytidine kinase